MSFTPRTRLRFRPGFGPGLRTRLVDRRASRGLTLIEIMVVVAIIAVLAGIGYPQYTNYVLKGHRAAAQADMMQMANLEQQYLLANRQYLAAANNAAIESGLGISLSTSVKDRYLCKIELPTAGSGFTITCTASGAQASDGDLTLNSSGVKTPAAKW